MANLLFNDTEATDRSAAGLAPVRAAGAAMYTGESSIVRDHDRIAAGETSALVARCVR